MSEKEHVFEHGYALLIGVGADLPVTVTDATALSSTLSDPRHAAYRPACVTLLTEETATRNGILSSFDGLIKQANSDARATVIIYYSGHGGYFEDSGDYFLVPYGYDPNQQAETAISGLEFTQKIEELRVKKLVVLLDCCHAGGIFASKGNARKFVKAPVPPELLSALSSGSGRVVIASSRQDELSWTGNPYSIFTACLLEAMQGQGAASDDGYVRILDILTFLFSEVPKRSDDSQHPFVKRIADLGDNFPVCYYLGGEKERHKDDLTGVSPTLTPGQRQRLERKQAGLQREWNLRSEKIEQMRSALAIEVNVALRFQLEKQLLAEETEISRLDEELAAIEQYFL